MIVYQAMAPASEPLFFIFLARVKYTLGAAVFLFITLPALSLAAIDIEFEGIDDELSDNIRLHLARWDSLPGTDIEAIQTALHPNIVKALQALGYYQSDIVYKLQEQQLTLTISPGEPVTWAEIDIQVLQGDSQATDFKDAVANHPFKTGSRLKHQDYEQFKRRLLNLANELGYLDAQLSQSQLRINPKEGLANVILAMKVGARYRLGSVHVNDTEITAELANIIIDTPSGVFFNADLVGEIYNRLLNSGYFTSINIELEKRPPSTANLHINMVDSPEHRVSTGVGYGTDTGTRLKLQWKRPHTNERGNSLQTQLQLSQVQQTLTARYRIPFDHPQNRFLSWDSGYNRKLVEDTLTQVATTGIVFHLLRESGWQYSAGINLDNEQSRVDDVIQNDLSYVIPSLHASKRKIWGDVSNPDFAYKYWLNVANSTDFLGSDTNFLRLDGGFNTVFSFAEKHSFLSRFELGAISADDFNKVPLSQRFFTGGDQSVRGYKFDRISPQDENGDLVGGQYFATASLEYRFHWKPQWQVALFVDQGRSYIQEDNYCIACVDKGEDYRTSAGVGVRWLSPVGFIATDVAFPLQAVGVNEEPDDPRLHIYLSIPL